MCFRERTSESDDLDYCPLGQLTLPVDNNAGGPPQTLNLGPGADTLNPEYSSTSSIGLLINVTRNGALLGFKRMPSLNTLLPLGTLRDTGFQEIIDNVRVNVRLGVECAPGFTGPECNTPVITTTTEGTTTEGATTEEATTEGAITEGTTTEGTTIEGTTTERPTTERPTSTTEGIYMLAINSSVSFGCYNSYR